MKWQLIGSIGPQAGANGKDGIGIASTVIDRDGHLVLTLTDGSTKDVGVVTGRAGADGLNGKNADPDEIRRHVSAAIAEIPKPKDGKDGADGLGFDDLVVLHDGERGFTMRFVKGDRVKEFAFSLPAEIYRGVYTEGKTYDRGDGVTWAGSEWHANETTTTKPGDGSKAWTLKVKRGRDGKDGRDAVTVPVVSVGRAT